MGQREPEQWSHSCEGVRGLKWPYGCKCRGIRQVAFLRGSAWIEIFFSSAKFQSIFVAFLRGSAWIEITNNMYDDVFGKKSHSCEGVRGLKFVVSTGKSKRLFVAFLRGSAWIEILSICQILRFRHSRILVRECVD